MSRQDGSEKVNTELMWLAAIILFCFIIFAIWNYARHIIIIFFYSLDWVQIKLIELIRGLGTRGTDLKVFVEMTLTKKIDPFTVTYEELITVSHEVGLQTFLYIALMIFGMAGLCVWKMKGDGYRRNFTLAKSKNANFIKYQASHWKVVAPGAHFDPNSDDPLQAPQMTPMEWMRANNVALTEDEGLDYDAATKAFERQVGETWRGFHKAPAYVQAIAMICVFSARRHKKNLEFKEALATAVAGKDPKKAMPLIKQLVKEYLKEIPKAPEFIDKKAKKHAFTNPFMLGLFFWAKDQGDLLASGEFRWLKPFDRTLWYTLNNAGRNAYHIEAGGAVSHYFAEKVTGGAVYDPYVEGALTGLETYIEDNDVVDLDEFFRQYDGTDEDFDI